MRTVAENYWNGNTIVDACDLSVLLNPSQELANSIATGPQDELYTALDRFNSRLPDDVKLAVTPSWNWRPGTIPKFREYLINNIYKLNSKSNGLEHLMRRAREWSWNFRYWENNILNLESLKYNLKQDGYSPNVDIEEFKERLTKIVTKLQKEADLIKEMTNGNTTVKLLVSGLNNPRYTKLHIDIILCDLNLSVYQGSNLLNKLPLKPIHIIFEIDLRKYLRAQEGNNTFLTSLYTRGLYLSKELSSFARDRRGYHQETFFPYISTNGYSVSHKRPRYGTVCLDKYDHEVKSSILKGNLVNAIMSIMSWAQYYNTEFSHPYNQLKMLHIGMPSNYSKEYASVVGFNNNCQVIMENKYSAPHYDSMEYIMNSGKMHNHCKEIKCQFSDSCSAYSRQRRMVLALEDLEHRCKVEGFMGQFLEEEEDVTNVRYKLNDWYSIPHYSDNYNYFMEAHWIVRAHGPRNFNSFLLDFYTDEIPTPETEIILTEEEQREAVMRFATGSN